jgi:hypothetical protein
MDIVLLIAFAAALVTSLWLGNQLRHKTLEIAALHDQAASMASAKAAADQNVMAERGRAEAAMMAKQMAETAASNAAHEQYQLHHWLDEATARANAANARADAANARAESATAEAARAAQHAEALAGAATQANARAEWAAAEASKARGQTDSAVAEAAQETARAVAAEAEAHHLRTESAAGADSLPAATLWNLELARSERTWRNSVASGPDAEEPFTHAADPLRVAIEVEVAALREEVGADINLDWQVGPPLPPDACFSVLRGAQEVLAAAAKVVDGGMLVARSAEGGSEVVLTLNIDDPDSDQVIDLTLPTFAGSGIEPMPNGVRVRVPPAAATVTVPTTVTAPSGTEPLGDASRAGGADIGTGGPTAGGTVAMNSRQ